MGNIERIQASFIARKVQASKRAWKDVIEEEKAKIKGYCVDQNNSNHENNYNSILAPNEDIDNGQVYSEVTGETLRDL